MTTQTEACAARVLGLRVGRQWGFDRPGRVGARKTAYSGPSFKARRAMAISGERRGRTSPRAQDVRQRRKVGVGLRGGQDRKAVIGGIEIGVLPQWELERCLKARRTLK